MKHLACLLLTSLAILTNPSYASVVLYQDSGQFQAAAPAGTTETFEGYAAPASFVNVSDTTLGNLSFGASTFIVDPDFDGGGYNWNTGAVLNFANSPTVDTTLSFAPTTAFSALFGTVGPTDDDFGQDIIVTVNDQSFLLGTGSFANWTFYGFISDTPFSSVSFSTAQGFPILDNVFVGNSTATVPEPTSLAMLALGILCIATVRRRQEK
ncbi:PEP-CTERM sorting domain-containing protein [Undibacterium sp. TJN25]|uniref:PEP-CTERM sorting domain-containing protein n=1 Tax=Undibacterium sp. TJN25 TaxID=3413056 RepID=UPI003BF3BCAD